MKEYIISADDVKSLEEEFSINLSFDKGDELIRCKDCKHRDPEDKKCDCGHSIRWQLPRSDEWFCADAERRGEGWKK